jgi:hypothetical protein
MKRFLRPFARTKSLLTMLVIVLSTAVVVEFVKLWSYRSRVVADLATITQVEQEKEAIRFQLETCATTKSACEAQASKREQLESQLAQKEWYIQVLKAAWFQEPKLIVASPKLVPEFRPFSLTVGEKSLNPTMCGNDTNKTISVLSIEQNRARIRYCDEELEVTGDSIWTSKKSNNVLFILRVDPERAYLLTFLNAG